MAGNSQRKGAVRKTGTKKGAVVGSGGQNRRSLRGRGPTPAAENRPNHPAARRAGPPPATSRPRAPKTDLPETVVGRNPVVEALRAGVPATALYVAQGIQLDERVTEAVQAAGARGLSILEVGRAELDRLTNRAVHQGLALTVPPYQYADPADVMAGAMASGEPPLLVAVDGVTDPRNLGAIVRSAAAFGAHGVLVPQRRSAGMTASAWRTSAGTAARIPVARCTNLVRTLKDWAGGGAMIVGLDADGTMSTDDFDLATGPLVLVIGSEGRGLARLTVAACDATVSIPMAREVESLNASVAAGVVLAEVRRRRRRDT
jgi:23S rRNA (guanosine2251-2'-O)-methyltransferase